MKFWNCPLATAHNNQRTNVVYFDFEKMKQTPNLRINVLAMCSVHIIDQLISIDLNIASNLIKPVMRWMKKYIKRIEIWHFWMMGRPNYIGQVDWIAKQCKMQSNLPSFQCSQFAIRRTGSCSSVPWPISRRFQKQLNCLTNSISKIRRFS